MNFNIEAEVYVKVTVTEVKKNGLWLSHNSEDFQPVPMY